MKFYVETLGCKANQSDSFRLARELAARGLRPTDNPAKARLIVLNTCTVTAGADQSARQRVRRLRAESPGALLAVTGCYAERDPAGVAALPEVDRVWGNRDKPALAELLLGDGFCSRLEPEEEEEERGNGSGRTRAFLKVQDGCDLRCSYCIIPQVRGRSRSRPAEELCAELAALVQEGYREIVLTGINTGSWGRDLSPHRSLVDLLRALLAIPQARLRLSSLEPLTVSDEVLELIAGEARLAPHLQVPLQSASDRILNRMARPYRLAGYARVLERARRRLPDAALGADVIAGFPGETEEDFRLTLEYVESSPLTYLHVFPYSPRPGTGAADRPERVPPPVLRERSRRLREAGERLSGRFAASFVGRRLEMLTLREGWDGGPRLRALSGNYLDVDLDWPGGAPNLFVKAEVTAASAARVEARCGLPAL